MATSTTTTIGRTSSALSQRWRLQNLPEKFQYTDVLRAYLACRRRKRTKASAVLFENSYESFLYSLLYDLNTFSYSIGRASVFVVLHPKPREVWAASFRDRIVHHLLYNFIGPAFEKRFIEDTYSCVKCRGTLAAINRVAQFCRQATEDWTRQAWVLQIDISNYFGSIDKNILWNLIEPRLGYSKLFRHYIRQSVFYNPVLNNPIIKTPHLHKFVPSRKSLWNAPDGNGLPIGNITSQFYANIYNDGLDKFVKHELGVKWYARYVDDAVLISHNREELYEWRDRIMTYLRDNLQLELCEKKCSIKPAYSGVNFVGSVILPYRRYTRRRTVYAAKAAIDNPFSTNSYLGMILHDNTYRLRSSLCAMSAFASSCDNRKVSLKVKK